MKNKKILGLMILAIAMVCSVILPVYAENVEKAAEIDAAKASFADLYEAINPSVVYIEVWKKESDNETSTQYSPFEFDWEDFFGPEFEKYFEYQNSPREEPEEDEKGEEHNVVFGSGTGFVWDNEGHIVTNNHVIEDAESVTVTYSDGIVRDAEVIGADPDSDLAVLLVKDFLTDVKPVTVGDSESLRPGDLVCAIGNPLGQTGTMTQGIVSALNRSFTVDNGDENGHYSIPNMIQTDASINPGNSGGVLINLNGEVVGVVNSFSSYSYSSAGIGYAIPSNLASRVVPQLIENGAYAHPWIGFSGIALTPDINAALELDHDQRGAFIQTVTEDSPAQKAGIIAGNEEFELPNSQMIIVGGDIITKIADRDVKSMDDIISYLSTDTNVGDTITLHVLRDGKELDVDLTLAARPTSAERQAAAEAKKQETEEAAGRPYLGVMVVDLNNDILDLMGLPDDTEGALISDVTPDSPAEDAGLLGSDNSTEIGHKTVEYGGDIIIAIDGEPIDGSRALINAIADHIPGDRVTLTILRGGEKQEIRMTLGNSVAR